MKPLLIVYFFSVIALSVAWPQLKSHTGNHMCLEEWINAYYGIHNTYHDCIL